MTRIAIALTAVATSATAADAGPLPSWSYSWSQDPQSDFKFDPANPTTVSATDRLHPSYSGWATMGFDQTTRTTSGNGIIDVGFRYANNQGGVRGASSTFRSLLHITEAASGQSGTLMFSENIYTLARPDTGVGIPIPYAVGTPIGPTSASVLLGTNLFTVRDNGFFADTFRGGEEFQVTVTPAETPEPATLVLAGIGLAGLAGRRLRRRTA